MNLSKLFEMQKTLDDRIIKEHGLEGRDLLPNLILSLQVELGELANEWQGFKHWKVNPQPKEHMLEEYVDCLHFILSIGLKVGVYTETNWNMFKHDNVIDQFNNMFDNVADIIGNHPYEERESAYNSAVYTFLGLGEMLGFTLEQIEQAYMEKNKVNHERQDNGY